MKGNISMVNHLGIQMAWKEQSITTCIKPFVNKNVNEQTLNNDVNPFKKID